MKIGIMCPTLLTYSGIDRVAEQQAKQFVREGHDVSLFTLKTNMILPPEIKVFVLGIPTNLLVQRIYRLLFPLDFLKAVEWLPKIKGFDVVYSHQYPMNWLAYLAKRRYGIKYVYYNHGYPPPRFFSSPVERTYMRLITFFANWTIKRADQAISVSHYLERELRKETGLSSDVVYNEINAQKFHPGIDGGGIRNQYHLGDAPVILFVGRVEPYKGIHCLIDAYKMVARTLPQARLIIAGKQTSKNYTNMLKKMSDDKVIFAEDVPDEVIPAYYAACNVYATATIWEGFDLPLAEAQVCGKPVVAFDIGPHPEIIKISGEAKLVPQGDINAMAAAILSFLIRQNVDKI